MTSGASPTLRRTLRDTIARRLSTAPGKLVLDLFSHVGQTAAYTEYSTTSGADGCEPSTDTAAPIRP